MRDKALIIGFFLVFGISVLLLTDKKTGIEKAASANVSDFLQSLANEDANKVLLHLQEEFQSEENRDANLTMINLVKVQLGELGEPKKISDIVFSAKTAAVPRKSERQSNNFLKQVRYSGGAVSYDIGLVSEDTGFYVDRLIVRIKKAEEEENEYKVIMHCSEEKDITINCKKV